jgi:hypothetical protein
MYCSTCKNEVDEELVERVAWHKANGNINPHLRDMLEDDIKQRKDDDSDDDQIGMFDLWSV